MSLTVRGAAERLVEHVGAVVVGKREVTEQLLGALLVEGHVLLDDVPGVGKTTLARAVARSLDLTFRRIQCTPDLVPSDITGVSIYDQRAGAFEYRPGPLSANVVLVDEINRATPRAQSALLEAMQERQVTVDEATHTLPDPFLVIATQNPVELEGTFPLPEAQLDRFLFLLNLGYPDADDEDTILRIHGPANVRAETLRPILNPAEIAELRDEVHGVRVGDAVRRYAVEIVRGTRRIDGVDLGASPRAALALYRAAQAHAAIRGRAYVLPDDVKAQAVAVLRHRLFLNADAQMRGRTTTVIIAEVLARTPVPAEDVAATAG
ncbi:MAG: MoxR family ATPase [Chloroflexi bacterium]|nr:MAG: MoxR family ATPase [Chloroflexota bacterium]TMG60988.1 MAG: MoxR family ATPase [Chloroflexota bacterium]